MTQARNDGWHQTACILCSLNCGIEMQLGGADGRHIKRIRGDKAHPASQGYTCEKPQRLDSYQNAADRLMSPLRRRPDGGFEAIDWDTAITEIAERFLEIKSQYGGETILYYGGGGQGNHLGGSYSDSTLKALGSKFRSNALAQETSAWPLAVRTMRTAIGTCSASQTPVAMPQPTNSVPSRIERGSALRLFHPKASAPR